MHSSQYYVNNKAENGKGIHRRVFVPINWKEFILVDELKVHLFEFPTNEVMTRSHL